VPASPARLVIAVTAASSDDVTAVAGSWRSFDDVRVDVVSWPPDLATAARSHLVVGISSGPGAADHHDAIDVWTDVAGARDLWQARLLPFRDNLVANRRAPRRRVAELVGPDPCWATMARRLIARLERLLGDAALRIDHIGSTAVPGLAAKDLVDIQVVLPDLAVANEVAAHARDAGFVRVPGRWTGPDRHGTRFDEVVLVDADPGRPVNVNLRAVGDPVWRETLRFRDWLITDSANRDQYLAFKQHLVETTDDVDAYSAGKLQWIGDALDRASE
jgi:GrpB-like predicted nucleotidyltransferase (UPF0157 family)